MNSFFVSALVKAKIRLLHFISHNIVLPLKSAIYLKQVAYNRLISLNGTFFVESHEIVFYFIQANTDFPLHAAEVVCGPLKV